MKQLQIDQSIMHENFHCVVHWSSHPSVIQWEDNKASVQGIHTYFFGFFFFLNYCFQRQVSKRKCVSIYRWRMKERMDLKYRMELGEDKMHPSRPSKEKKKKILKIKTPYGQGKFYVVFILAPKVFCILLSGPPRQISWFYPSS